MFHINGGRIGKETYCNEVAVLGFAGATVHFIIVVDAIALMAFEPGDGWVIGGIVGGSEVSKLGIFC